jgi:hypothetical protein
VFWPSGPADDSLHLYKISYVDHGVDDYDHRPDHGWLQPTL